jgi:hypothetical protein
MLPRNGAQSLKGNPVTRQRFAPWREKSFAIPIGAILESKSIRKQSKV